MSALFFIAAAGAMIGSVISREEVALLDIALAFMMVGISWEVQP